MNSQTTQTTIRNNAEEQWQSEAIVRVQQDVDTSQNVVDPLFRNGLILIGLVMLFVASIYYGFINP